MKLEQVQKVKDILHIKLRYPTCDNCSDSGNSHHCRDNCISSWSISEEYAEELAREIVEKLDV